MKFKFRKADERNIELIKCYTNDDGKYIERGIGYFSTIESAVNKAVNILINECLESDAAELNSFKKKVSRLRKNIENNVGNYIIKGDDE